MSPFVSRLIASLPLLGILALTACEQAVVEAPEVVRPIRIMTISGLEGGEVFRYPGEIQGVQTAELAFEVAGQLTEFPIQEGVNVEQGMLLAQLDSTDFQASLDAADARFRSSRETLQRYAEVFEKGGISEQELDNRRREFEVDRAGLDSAQKAFKDTSLRAPFSGRVGKTYVDNFNNVQAKQAIVLIQDLSELEIVVNVPEQDWLRAAPGLTLAQQSERVRPEVSLSSLPGRTFPAVVTEVAASADPVTRTFEARARFNPPDDIQILPGMSATVTIYTPENLEQGIVSIYVPVSAVRGGNDGSQFVWTVNDTDMTVSQTPVIVGQLSGGDIEIKSGLGQGDRVAVSGVQHLTDNMRIRELSK